jgi:hypothetical protein
MIVERMKQLQMQQARAVGLDGETAGRAAGAVIIGFRPAVAALDDADAVRPQQMQFAQLAADIERLDIGIARQQQMAVERLEEIRPAHAAVRLPQQRQQRMIGPLAITLVSSIGTEAVASATSLTQRCATGLRMKPSRDRAA